MKLTFRNQTAAIVIGALILAVALWFIFKYTGVNLSSLQP